MAFQGDHQRLPARLGDAAGREHRAGTLRRLSAFISPQVCAAAKHALRGRGGAAQLNTSSRAGVLRQQRVAEVLATTGVAGGPKPPSRSQRLGLASLSR